MRNNQERLGLSPEEISNDSSSADQIVQQGTDISFVCPTEAVELPSKGRYYPDGHPLHNKDFVEIRHMTAKDEEVLTSKSLLQKGIAIDKMVQGVLVDKNIKIDDLLISDKNAIVLAARITGYGPEYRTNVMCPVCDTKTVHDFNLLDIKLKEEVDNARLSSLGTFEITLPKTNTKVELKLLTGNDEKALKMMADKKKKHNLPESPLMDQLKTIIVSVNGNSSRQYVEDFVNKMLARHSSFIREEYARLAPNLDLKQDFECPTCGSFSRVGIPFTTDFFWPGR